MKKFNRYRYLFFTCIIFLQACSDNKKTESASTSDTTAAPAAAQYYTADDFKLVDKIDAHIHVRTEDSSFIKQAEEDNFRLLDINVEGSVTPTIEQQRDMAIKHVNNFPERTAFATTISVKNWNDPNWQAKTISYLKDSFTKGAIGVKVWKNIGMSLKDKDGKFVMIDHPRFDTIFKFIAANNIPLLSHQGEPKNCWLPIEEMTVVGDKNYFFEHPQYHMYLHPEYPSYEDQINARDNMVAKNPDLKVISVHLASLEWDVNEIAKRLDKYPNLAVDMAARIPHLFNQATTNWQNVHDFFIKYQDRLIYATDIVTTAEEKPENVKKNTHETWLQDWRFFATNETLINPNNKAEFKGLHLPKEVIDKIYRTNAEKWIPGLVRKI